MNSNEQELDPMVYWKLCERLSIYQAVMLMIGRDPENTKSREIEGNSNTPSGYGAAKTALVNAATKQLLDAEVVEEDEYDHNGEQIRRIKATWPYTPQEVAALFGIHKEVVRRWLALGLHALPGPRPILVRGDELARFLNERQRGRKRKCAPTEFYCFKCREPREVFARAVDVLIESPTRLRLKGLCGVCDTAVNKVQSTKRLAKIRADFDVQQLHGEHLLVCIDPSVNVDLEMTR